MLLVKAERLPPSVRRLIMIVALKVYGTDGNSQWFGPSAVPSSQDIKKWFYVCVLMGIVVPMPVVGHCCSPEEQRSDVVL